MLSLNNIKPSKNSTKARKRVGRWTGSGYGTFAGRWEKGQNSRSWSKTTPWFEWGQTPLFRRMPKLKGFSNARFKTEYTILNVSDLEDLANNWLVDVSKDSLLENKVIKNKNLWVKILWNGEITKKINLKVSAISNSAREKVEKAGWSVEIV